LNSTEKAFTWTNSSSSTRIDQLWAFNDLFLGLLAADIIEIDTLIKSVYDIVLASFDLIHLTSNYNLAKIKKNQAKRTIFLYDETKELDFNIILQSEYWSDEVLDDLKGWCEMIDGNQEKMLASLFDKPFSKIKIDQLLTEDKKARHLWTEQDDINMRQKISLRTTLAKKAKTDTHLLKTGLLVQTQTTN
ncbi:31318_t:CDS:2, partial [Gigaspora margarita]